MHPNSISNKGVDLVKEFEGLHELKEDGMVYPYKCSAGVLTQGFGSTRGIKADQGWTTEYCEERLTKDLNEHAEAIKHYVTVPLTQNQYDALVSFIFNLGATAFRNRRKDCTLKQSICSTDNKCCENCCFNIQML